MCAPFMGCSNWSLSVDFWLQQAQLGSNMVYCRIGGMNVTKGAAVLF